MWQSTLGCRNVITRTKSGCGKLVLSSFSLCTASCRAGNDRGALVYATSSRGDWFGVTGEADSTTVRLLLVPSMMGSIKAYVDIFETHVVFTMPSFTSWDSVRLLCGPIIFGRSEIQFPPVLFRVREWLRVRWGGLLHQSFLYRSLPFHFLGPWLVR